MENFPNDNISKEENNETDEPEEEIESLKIEDIQANELPKPNKDISPPENINEFVEKENIDNSGVDLQDDISFDSLCSICNTKITTKKFICVICSDCILCPNCEKTHIHPVLKCKNHQLSELKDIFIYLNKRNKVIQSLVKNEKDTSVFGSLFSEKYELQLETPNTKFSMRPNKKINLPIIIQNLSNNKINCESTNLVLYGKNTKDLKVYEKALTQTINKREQIDVFIVVESNNYYGEYDFSLELYSTKNIKIKNNILEYKIIVNNDEEEEKLNEEFSKFPEILIMSKETKEGIKKILRNENIKEDPITILQFLKNNNNDIKKTMDNLISLNDLNQNKIF